MRGNETHKMFPSQVPEMKSDLPTRDQIIRPRFSTVRFKTLEMKTGKQILNMLTFGKTSLV